MIREPFQRFYPSTQMSYTDTSIPEKKREERARLAADVEAYLARGGRITSLPYGAVSLPTTYGSAIFELHISPPTLPGSAPHNPSRVESRAKRRKYGRLA